MVAVRPAPRLANEHVTRLVPLQLRPPWSSLTAVTTRRASTLSATATLWAVLKLPVFLTLIVKLWLPSPAVTLAGVKVLLLASATSPVIASFALHDALPVSSALVLLATLWTLPAGVAASTW